jgi:PAS domain S-box-containing protein
MARRLLSQPPMHALLERQLRRHLGATEAPARGLDRLLAAVSEAYHQADQDRLLLERALDISSQELLEANAELTQGLALVQEAAADRERAAAATAAETALRESEAKYRDLFDHAPVGYHELDAAGRITRVNRTELSMLGYEAADMLGRHVCELGGDEASRERLRSDRTRRALPVAALQMRRKDGSLLPVLVEERPLHDADGTVCGIRATMRDATEIHVLEAQLRQAQKMEAVGRLAGGVAHDFNNLLTAILGYSELAMREVAPGRPLRRELEEIHKAATRAGSLTAQLLAFSRKQLLQPRILDLGDVVADMERMLRRLIGEDVELRTVRAARLDRVCADRGQLEQVLLNLAVNARDAIGGGGWLRLETANVEVTGDGADPAGRLAGRYVMLAVADNGCGMDDEVKSHIFEPFYTTKELGRGTGLGLATVYGIVRQSGGFIEVDSRVGQGTTFRIYLPSAREEQEQPREVEASEQTRSASGTILVVEDDPAVRQLTCTILAGGGYQVLEAGGAEQARELAGTFTGPIDLLLTDVVMPGDSGSVLAADMVKLRPSTRTLFVSGYSDGELSRRGELLPGIELLEKPFGPEELRRKVHQVLNGPAPPVRLAGEAA